MEIAKQTIPDQATLDGVEQSLVLNGAGIRYKFVFKIYIGALYLPEKSQDAEAIIASEGPKRILMHFLYDKVQKKDMDKAWKEGFADNLDKAMLVQLGQRMDDFSDLFTDTVEGDTIWLDNIPGSGTRVTINGAEKGLIPGDDFYPALIQIWIGKDPITTDLKKQMLGLE
ncbi:MAG: hypothetical protein FHK78_02475 [Sedimenticola selenatireducens]|uniref:Chalcone isomerase domain-containing protein n=2 Tax=Sedimenticola selenatireducens TaxID=191960 RepID=A0A557S2C5_9GAMM|nr:hypothetical protein FHP88_14040 [Sedimenticola selenatireducens]TVT66166.1 MAG: hypothetical protein FHK78_02475 [Sedimenticola selenatireducens]